MNMAIHLPLEVIAILKDFNPWWETGKLRKPAERYRRRGVPPFLARLAQKKGLIEIIRGPRQVGKTTALEQAVESLLATGIQGRDILFVRFDQEVLRETTGGLLPI